MEDKDDLDDLKKDYQEIQKKYELPDFEELNKDFNIERIAEVNTDLLLREIRKFIAEKFSNYLRFIETLLNPVNAPMFAFSIIKTIQPEDKKILAEIYKKLAKVEVDLIELDLDFIEEKESYFIRDSYKIWQDIKKDMLNIFSRIKKNWDTKYEMNGKGYLG